MTTPTTCPHCGAEKVSDALAKVAKYECGRLNPSNICGGRTSECYERELAKLRAEIATIGALLDVRSGECVVDKVEQILEDLKEARDALKGAQE